MSAASTSNLSRWRPAVLALTACSAGLGLYYLYHGWSFGDEPPVQLHRSNAVHRRSRGQARRRSSINRAGDPTTKISAQEMTRMFREESGPFGEVHRVWHAGRREHIEVTRGNLLTLDETLATVGDPQEAELMRDEFEAMLVITFLCAKMPVNSVLKDPAGRSAFIDAFEDEGFHHLGVVSRVLTQWNRRNLDQEAERLRMLQAEITPSSLPSFPRQLTESAEDELFLDRSRPTIQSGEVTVEISLSTDNEEDDDDEDSEASWIPEGEDGLVAEDGKKDGQTLLNMLYHIAEDQSRQNGYIHHGVSCNSCSMIPIRGIRYRCSNCPDYDLCEQCESMQVHPKTHLLYKIRVPAPFFDNSQRPQAPRYPGKLSGLPNHLPRQVSKKLSQQSGRELAEVEALWDTFKCLATVEWPTDPLGFAVAIDRDCFDLCFLASTSNARKPPNMPIHDRIFAFFDSNSDNLIGFEEFVTGVATIRTKDKKVRLNRTFWVYDFNEDGFVCRNDFLFMFRSYYALSKELTIDMIQNMEYDVLEGPNPQDILLGTQPISAAYNGTHLQPHKRKAGEGKVLNLEGEQVISDGEGVITERNPDVADYWEVIADASEKLAFGFVVENIASLDRFLSDDPGIGPPDDHPLLNEEWCPMFVMLDDIESVVGVRINPDQLESKSDRRACIKAALKRRHEVRRVGVERRKERNSFYDSGPVVYRQKDEEVLEKSDSNPGGQIATTSAVEGTKAPKRVPPPLEDDVGQEYLFQMLQEGLNELLDPLFKQREELSVEAKRTRPLRDKIREKLDAFGTPAMRRLCLYQVENLENMVKERHEKDPFDLDIDIRQELRKLISLQENEYSDEYLKNLKMMLETGVIDDEEYQRRTKIAEAAAGELLATESIDSDGQPEKPAQNTDSEGHLKASQQANGLVVGDNDGDEPMPDAGETPPQTLHPEEQEAEPVVEPLGQERRHEANSSPSRPDPRGAGEFLASDSAPPSPISNHMRQEVEDFEAADLAIEDYIATHDPEAFWGNVDDDDLNPYAPRAADDEEQLSIGSSEEEAFASPTSTIERVTEELRDPTMPQNRPNSLDDVKRPEDITLDEELLEREPTQQELKYYLMLECLEEEDRRRGGAGRLNLEEFEAIMGGPRGARLTFTGMFFEMVNF